MDDKYKCKKVLKDCIFKFYIKGGCIKKEYIQIFKGDIIGSRLLVVEVSGEGVKHYLNNTEITKQEFD